MEFKIKRKDFLEGLSQTQGVVEKKNTMPILANILLEADKQGLKITATDMEVAVSCEVPAQVLSQGKITVLAKSIQDIVRESNRDEIRFVLGEGDKIELQAGSAVFKIPGLSAKEFPSFPTVDTSFVTVPSEPFRRMLDKTSFAMANDETRYNLNGILFQKKEGKPFRMVATDGHRLSMVDRPELLEGISEFGVIIPRKGVGELKKIAGGEGTFDVAIGKNGLLARKGNEVLYVRYMEGEFPEYTAVIPTDNNINVLVPRGELVGALRRVSLLSNEKSRGIVMNFSPGHLEISATNPDLGEAREEFLIDYRGQKMGIGFNAHYLLDVVETLQDEKVIFVLKGETFACLIKSESDKGFLSVVMPMRI